LFEDREGIMVLPYNVNNKDINKIKLIATEL
jgi:hypothetical protein